MALDGWDKQVSPYHPGEQELHARLGRRELQERHGRQILRPFMPEQHQTFFAQLPFFIAGSVDRTGAPWASILFGKPGFVSTPDDRTLTIHANPIEGDPIEGNAIADAPVSFVGIELPTRRRNRVNGIVRERQDQTMVVDVVQSFGNCPQYIHTRDMDFTRDPALRHPVEIETFTALEGAPRDIVARADTFFVASHNPNDDMRSNGGVDVNHRGGRPGFVRIEGNTLTVPDFIGNFAFNTLGNFLVNPKAGLMFIDFVSGDIIQMTGTVELLWDATEEVAAFQGAERAWRFHLSHGHRLVAASPLRFRDGQPSPNARLTGTWAEAAQRQAAEAARKAWRPFRVAEIRDETPTIRSFYLQPEDGGARLPQKPGQYLTLRVQPEAADQPLIRTYTLSSAASDGFYRLSVKRETGDGTGPSGRVSTWLHENIDVGDRIETRAPTGSFWLDTAETRPVVLIAGGVGITPMVAMARQAMTDGFARRHLRPLTIIHSVRHTAERAFAAEFTRFQNTSEGALRYVSLVSRPGPGEKAGEHFHAEGRVRPEILRAVLPLDDYDFYLCGPAGFMQSVYDMLLGLGVRDGRIQAESFGPASLIRQTESDLKAEAEDATVIFSRSGVEQPWTPADGTLLELAEAHGLTPDHGCRSGACGSCAVRLVAGEVAYRHAPGFPPEPGDVLLCSAVPAAPGGRIELDL